MTVEIPTPTRNGGTIKVPEDEYSYTFNNQDGYTPECLDPKIHYTIAEHIMWAPRKIRVVSIGAGASGIMLCYKKEKEFGDSIDLTVYERNDDVGGVWHTNRYPGCRCDVPSPAYQFSFAPSAEWPKYYSSAPDIKAYYREFVERHEYLGKYIKLQHEVTKAVWQEGKGTWLLYIIATLVDGDKLTFTDEAEFLVGNIGVLHTWKWPDVPGRANFRGKMTHSAAYDTSIDLSQKRLQL